MTPTNNRGWTLIELMAALVIFAIIAAIAYPAYNRQVIKARRADGIAMLYETAQREQEHYTKNNSFTATIGEGGLGLSATSSEGYYTLSITATATTYTLTATPAGNQTADTWCGSFTLTHLGEKDISGGSLSADRCW
jgi:type IV pilus assembly protein PilE